jgi:uncharacterized protein YbjT (DUF2867 family)
MARDRGQPAVDAAAATTATPNPLVVVAGATGHLGQEVCLALNQRGYRLRALCRPSASPQVLERLREKADAEIFPCEVTRPSTLAGACAGAAAVVSCLGARHPSSGETKDGAGPFAIDRDAVIALFREAVAAGAAQFVAVGSIEGPAIRQAADFIRAKEEAFDEVKRLGVGTPTHWTIVRPGAMTKEFETIVARKIKSTGGFTLVGDGSALFSPVAASDLAAWMAAEVVGGSSFPDLDVTVAGPEDLTYREAMLRVADAVGVGRDKVRLREAPAWLFGVVAGGLSLFPGLRAKAGVFRWLAYCTTHSMVGDVRVGTITLEQAVRRAWASGGGGGGGEGGSG